ncbi:hypothetical protein LCGC14_1677190, partial [marine sediment metagenome]
MKNLRKKIARWLDPFPWPIEEAKIPQRKGTGTYTGRTLNIFTMGPNDVHVMDIAHALSNMCRYNGQVSHFYSVAEHCVLMARSKFPGDPKWKLLHDAGEAY